MAAIFNLLGQFSHPKSQQLAHPLTRAGASSENSGWFRESQSTQCPPWVQKTNGYLLDSKNTEKQSFEKHRSLLPQDKNGYYICLISTKAQLARTGTLLWPEMYI